MAHCSAQKGSCSPSVMTGRRSCYSLTALNKLFRLIFCNSSTKQAPWLLFWKSRCRKESALCTCLCEFSLHSWRVQLGRYDVHKPSCFLVISSFPVSCLVSPDSTQNVVSSCYFQVVHGFGSTGECQQSDAALWEAGPLEVCLVGDNPGCEGKDSKETEALIIH